MQQQEKLTPFNWRDNAADAVSEMTETICPHQMKQMVNEIMVDLVLEIPDYWTEDHAKLFQALRIFTDTLCQHTPPKAEQPSIN